MTQPEQAPLRERSTSFPGSGSGIVRSPTSKVAVCETTSVNAVMDGCAACICLAPTTPAVTVSR